MAKKKILLLGATGSIGTQTLDIIRDNPDRFELVGVSAGHNEKRLKEIIREFRDIQAAGLSAEGMPDEIEGVKLYSGEGQMRDLIENLDFDVLVNAAVGFRGLEPTLKALEKDRDVALANKESLVCGGELVKQALAASKGKLIPIDSEHSAILQCLRGNTEKEVSRLIITASGGSFRDRPREELENVSVEEALSHPNWAMGKRITLDSASMVNKAFEVMEAHYLFDLPYEKIETVLHPESIVHSMVEYEDHAVMAQLGSADMHLPIQYALCYPERIPLDEKSPLDMTKTRDLHFREMDFERYPMLKLAWKLGEEKGNRGTVMNGADEEAVELFLEGRIGFLDIERAILAALEAIGNQESPAFTDLKEADRAARDFVKSMVWLKNGRSDRYNK